MLAAPNSTYISERKITAYSKKYGVISDTMADSFHFVFVPLYTLYCRKYKKLLRQEKSTEKKNKYRKGEKHEVCSTLWIHYAIEKP